MSNPRAVDGSRQNNHRAGHEHEIRGALFVLGASLLFATMGAFIKHVSQTLPNEMVVFFRNAFGFLALLPWLLVHRTIPLTTSRLRFHILRSLAGVTAMYCFFFALAELHLAEAVVLNFTAPLFMPLLALWWLKEHSPRVVLGAVAVGFLGVLFLMKPGTGVFSPVAIIGLASGFFAGLAMVSIRRMAATEPTTRVVFYFSAICTAISAVPLLWSWQTPDAVTLLQLAGIGILATMGQLLLTRGYSLGSPARMGPFSYGSVLFATFYGWAFWGERLGVLTLVGSVLVVVAGILATRRTPGGPGVIEGGD